MFNAGKKIILLVCMFLYVYSIQLKGMPISCNILFGIIGAVVYILKQIRLNQSLRIMMDASLGSMFILMLSVIVVSFFTLIYNSTSDVVFIKSMLVNLFTLFGAYFISLLIQITYKKVLFYTLAKYLIMAASIQMLLSLWLFLTPNSSLILNSILSYSYLESATLNSLEGFRLLGFGTTFFGSGIIHSFILLIITIVFQIKKFNFLGNLAYTFAFLLISIVGMMMARTVIVGLVLALILSLYKTRFWRLILSKQLQDIFKNLVLVVAVFTIIIINLPPDIYNALEVAYMFGFELFENIFSSGKIETGSTNVMFDMYVFPDNWKTWLIGDGYFADPLNPIFAYYMGTDIGFIRMLFYFGGIGLIVFFLYQFVVIFQVYKRNVDIGLLPFVFIYILFVALNLKGLTDLFPLVILFYFCSKNEIELNTLKT